MASRTAEAGGVGSPITSAIVPHPYSAPRIRPVLSLAGLAAVLLAGLLAGCSPPPFAGQRLRVEVLAILPHDPIMYTEGLEIHDGVLYEDSGLAGQSRL